MCTHVTTSQLTILVPQATPTPSPHRHKTLPKSGLLFVVAAAEASAWAPPQVQMPETMVEMPSAGAGGGGGGKVAPLSRQLGWGTLRCPLSASRYVRWVCACALSKVGWKLGGCFQAVGDEYTCAWNARVVVKAVLVASSAQ